MTGFAAYLVRRLAAAILFVVVVSTGALVLAWLAPGDGLSTFDRSPEALAAERARLGLDRPIGTLVVDWLRGLATFDLGRSSIYSQPVAPIVSQRAARTAELAGVALFFATVIGLPIGLLTGARPRGWLASIVMPISTALIACPPIIGVLALLWLAVTTGWLSTSPGSLALPAIALALPLAAALERLQSQATADAIGAFDITAAAARGVPRWRRLWVHAARQSLRPVLGVYGLAIGGLLSGSLAVEIVTAFPGLARLTMDALEQRDRFLVAGCALFAAAFIAAGNLAADLVRAAADPRVRERA